MPVRQAAETPTAPFRPAPTPADYDRERLVPAPGMEINALTPVGLTIPAWRNHAGMNPVSELFQLILRCN